MLVEVCTLQENILKRKLFSTKQKQDLADFKTHYFYNTARKNQGAIYSLQAAQSAKEMLDLFTQISAIAVDEADVAEVCERVYENMRLEVNLTAKTFEGQHIQLKSWLENQSRATNKKLADLKGLKKV